MKFNTPWNKHWPLLALPVAAVIAAAPYVPGSPLRQAATVQTSIPAQTTQTPAQAQAAAAQEQAAQGAQPQVFDNSANNQGGATTQDSTAQDSTTQNGLGTTLNDMQSSFFNDPNWSPLADLNTYAQRGNRNTPSQTQTAQSSAATAVLKKIYDASIASAVRVNVGNSGIGSGFFMSKDGLILTAAHVALGDPGAKLSVTTQSGQKLPVTLVGYDEVKDVAVLKAQGSNFPALKLTASSPKVGAGVVAIGNSRGAFDGGRAGAVTALNVSLDPSFPSNLIESNMPLAPGDSGGPVLNAVGEVVGVSTAISNQRGQFSSYFVPITSSSTLIGQLVAGAKRGVPVLGIGVADARQFMNQRGVLVTSVTPGLGAAKAGLKGGSVREFRDASGGVTQDVSGADIIVGVDGKAISTPSALVSYLRSKQAGDRVTLKIRRGTQTLDVPVTLSAKPTNQG
jgi:serine protease Do